MNRQGTDFENILTIHICDQTLVSRTYKELLLSNNRKTNSPIKCGKKFGVFTREDKLFVNKYMKKYITLLVITEMKMKTTINTITDLLNVKLKTMMAPNIGETVETIETNSYLVGNYNGTITLKKNLVISCKTKCTLEDSGSPVVRIPYFHFTGPGFQSHQGTKIPHKLHSTAKLIN